MAKYVKRKCPRCGYIFEKFEMDYTAIGNPFIECPSCKTQVKFSNINEWKLMTIGHKAKYLFASLPYVGGWAFGGFIIGIVVTFLLDTFTDVGLTPDDRTAIFSLGAIIFGLYGLYKLLYYNIYKAIKESNKRMKDKDYAEKLKLMNYHASRNSANRVGKIDKKDKL